MKILLALLLTICVSVCYADTLEVRMIKKAVVQEEDPPISQREVYDDVKQFITQLAESLSTTSEYLFSILVTQATVSGITDIIFILLALIFCSIWWTNLAKINKWRRPSNPNEYDENEDARNALLWVGSFIIGALSIGAVLSLPTAITKLVNPEYWALKRVLEFIKY